MRGVNSSILLFLYVNGAFFVDCFSEEKHEDHEIKSASWPTSPHPKGQLAVKLNQLTTLTLTSNHNTRLYSDMNIKWFLHSRPSPTAVVEAFVVGTGVFTAVMGVVNAVVAVGILVHVPLGIIIPVCTLI